MIPTVWFLYPETTGLSMEELDQMFINSPSVLGTVATAEACRREKREKGKLVIEGHIRKGVDDEEGEAKPEVDLVERV